MAGTIQPQHLALVKSSAESFSQIWLLACGLALSEALSLSLALTSWLITGFKEEKLNRLGLGVKIAVSFTWN